MPRLDITDTEIRRTPGALLIFRILSLITTDTKLKPLINHVHNMKVVPGQPPTGKDLPAPAIYCWPHREMVEIQGEDGLEAGTWYFTVKMIFKNLKSYTAIELNKDGTFKKAFPLDMSNHTALMEMLWIEERLKYIVNLHGHHNNWYFTFVQNGLLGEPNQIIFDMREFGGGDSKGPLLHILTFSFRILTWDHRDTMVATGDVTVSVVDAGMLAVKNATVTITDISGNTVEDSSGNHKWKTDVAGQVTISGLIATRNKGTTIAATKTGIGSGSSTGDITQKTNAFTITLV